MPHSSVPTVGPMLHPSVLYLAIGYAVGPGGLGIVDARLVEHGRVIEAIAEAALLVVLFANGLELRLPPDRGAWRVPLRLGLVAAPIGAGLVAAIACLFFDISFAGSLVLGAILAPTDGSLTGRVVPLHEGQSPTLRFALAGESLASTVVALPLVLLGLGCIGRHELGTAWLRWLLIDVVWAAACALVAGVALGWLAARGLRRLGRARASFVPQSLVLTGVLVAAYSCAVVAGGNGFLAVLAAGAVFGHARRPAVAFTVASTPRPAAFAHRAERVAKVAALLLLGAMLGSVVPSFPAIAFALIVLGVIRPAAVQLALRGLRLAEIERRTLAWFGVRRVASVFLLAHAVNQGLDRVLERELTTATLIVVAGSVMLHGLSATPLVSRSAGAP